MLDPQARNAHSGIRHLPTVKLPWSLAGATREAELSLTRGRHDDDVEYIVVDGRGAGAGHLEDSGSIRAFDVTAAVDAFRW